MRPTTVVPRISAAPKPYPIAVCMQSDLRQFVQCKSRGPILQHLIDKRYRALSRLKLKQNAMDANRLEQALADHPDAYRLASTPLGQVSDCSNAYLCTHAHWQEPSPSQSFCRPKSRAF